MTWRVIVMSQECIIYINILQTFLLIYLVKLLITYQERKVQCVVQIV